TPGVAGRGAGLVESIEIADHPFFVALQAHPEFKSRPMRPSPPFAGFVAAALGSGQRPAANSQPEKAEA
ncbi:hypothetical protein NL455_27800, partial [Klebsiella pneumoniae]|nr:hypothetical protein [Klebsiella pneumoniae]